MFVHQNFASVLRYSQEKFKQCLWKILWSKRGALLFIPEMWKWRISQVLKSISAKMRAGALESQAVRRYSQK